MRLLKVIAILLFGPLLGILVAFFVSALALPADPNFAANGGHASPGDGFGIMGFVLIRLLVSLPVSIWRAGVVLFGKPNATSQS
jgi:hypothetical protein